VDSNFFDQEFRRRGSVKGLVDPQAAFPNPTRYFTAACECHREDNASTASPLSRAATFRFFNPPGIPQTTDRSEVPNESMNIIRLSLAVGGVSWPGFPRQIISLGPNLDADQAATRERIGRPWPRLQYGDRY